MELINSLVFMLNEMSPYILLGFFIAGLMHSYVPQHTYSRHLSGRGWRSVVKAAAIGIPLPLCSCGVLPAAIAMRRNGASRAASTSFLIATPQTGVDSICATWSLLGPAFALIRPIAALVTALLGGVAVGRAEGGGDALASASQQHGDEAVTGRVGHGRKLLEALRYGFVDLVGSIGGWLVAGLVIAAMITVYVPADFFAVIGSKPLLSMLAVLVIAIPMYVCATGSIPIALSLMLKGLSPGTALVLLMAGPAANFASFALISREMGRKTAIIYLAAIVAGAMAFGLTIDYLLPADWFALGSARAAMAAGCHSLSWLTTGCSAVLVALLVVALVKGHKHHHIKASAMTRKYTIKGMNCPHCQATVKKSISGVKGVGEVDVDLRTGIATVEGTHNAADVVTAVRNAGFEAIAD